MSTEANQEENRQLITVLSEDEKVLCEELSRDKETKVQNRFLQALRKIEHSPQYASSNVFNAPYGYFRGRPMIGEETVVTGGIFVSAGAHEAIVVDEKYGYLAQILENIFQLAEKREKEGKNFKQGILTDISRIVQHTLKFDPAAVTKLLKDKNIGADAKVSLDIFIQARVGVARHQVLLAAYLIEKLRKKGLLNGRFAFDPRIKKEHGEDERLFYINSVGKVFVVDPLGATNNVENIRTFATQEQRQGPTPESKGYDFMH